MNEWKMRPRGPRTLRLLAVIPVVFWVGCPQNGTAPRSAAIRTLAFSPTGQMVAGDADGFLRFLDSDARVMRRVQAHLGSTRGVAVNASASKVVSVGDDGKAMVFSRDGGLLFEKTVSGAPLKTVAFQPEGSEDSETFATGGDDAAARILRGADGDQVGQTLRGHVGAVNGLAFGPAGTPVEGVIVTTGADGTLKAFLADGSSSAALFSQNAHGQAGNSITFSPDGAFCPTASEDGSVKVWPAADAGMPDWTPLFELPVGSPVLAIAFSPDGAVIGTASADGRGRLWNSANGELLHVLEGEHTGAVNAIAFNPDVASRVVATAGEDGRVVRWNIDTGAVIR
jgi:WD40 repeat protein